jgi:hypothetical protein
LQRSELIVTYVVSAFVVLCLVWPLARPINDDSYPVSHFPMFAEGRMTPVLSLAHVRSVHKDGARRPVSARITGNGTVMQALSSISQAIGRGTALEFCERVAARVAALNDESAVEIEVVAGRFHILDYFTHERRALDEVVHARCPVPSAAPTPR